MLPFLIKKFIKQPDDMQSAVVRQRYGNLACLVGITSNLFLFAVKICIGLVLNSVAVMADSFNNLTDSATSIVTLFGLKLAARPPDEEHPFGHGRIEYICAFVVSVAIILIGYEFFKSSLSKILHPEPVAFNLLSVAILSVTMFIKLWQSSVNRTIGRKINSSALIATATDSRNDVVVTLCTIVSLLINRLFDLNVDGVIGVLVASFLIYSGIDIAKDMFTLLLGNAADPALVGRIKQKILAYDGIVSVHDLVIHNYGPHHSMATIHAEVPSDVHINESHEVIDRAEKEISAELGIFLVIHMDPIDLHNEKLNTLKTAVIKQLSLQDERLNAHDFRLIDSACSFNLIFDLVVPHEYKTNKILETESIIYACVKEVCDNCNCVINVEKGFEGY